MPRPIESEIIVFKWKFRLEMIFSFWVILKKKKIHKVNTCVLFSVCSSLKTGYFCCSLIPDSSDVWWNESKDGGKSWSGVSSMHRGGNPHGGDAYKNLMLLLLLFKILLLSLIQDTLLPSLKVLHVVRNVVWVSFVFISNFEIRYESRQADNILYYFLWW